MEKLSQRLAQRFTLRRQRVKVARWIGAFADLRDQFDSFQFLEPAGQGGRGETSELRLDLVEVHRLSRGDGVQDVKCVAATHGDHQRLEYAVTSRLVVIETSAITRGRCRFGSARNHRSRCGSGTSSGSAAFDLGLRRIE